MSTDISHRSTDNAIIIYIDGDLTTNSSPDVEADILEVLGEKPKNLVLNIAKVGFVASTGLRIILSLGKRMHKAGLKLCVCEMNSTNRSVFEISGFESLFPVYDTEDEALENV